MCYRVVRLAIGSALPRALSALRVGCDIASATRCLASVVRRRASSKCPQLPASGAVVVIRPVLRPLWRMGGVATLDDS